MTVSVYPKGKFKKMLEGLLLSETGKKKAYIYSLEVDPVNEIKNPQGIVACDVFDYKIILRHREKKTCR
jgi:hypothetical protein